MYRETFVGEGYWNYRRIDVSAGGDKCLGCKLDGKADGGDVEYFGRSLDEAGGYYKLVVLCTCYLGI